MLKKPLVIITRKLPDAIETRLLELFDTRLNAGDQPMTAEELTRAVKECDVLVPTVTDRIDAGILSQAGPQLKLIANFGAGIDHIDMDAAKAKGITVTNTPSVLTEDTADMALALILAVPRRIPEGTRLLRKGGWQGWSPTFMLGRRIAGCKLGIIGMGRIGQAVARRAHGGFGMQIHYHNRRRLHESVENQTQAAYWPKLDDMLAEVDIVSIHCPHTKDTHHLINADRLALMKPEAAIINTARGAIIDEEALIGAINNKKLLGAGLDVYEREPHVSEALKALENVVLLPHMSSATVEARVEMGGKVLINIRSFVDGHKPPDRVLA